ncbi:MAG: major facilitator superfamily domain-containing protein [Monoraphidium minutum]|nr:MAG: major facilitator superfamily domain-containing protein [Monoraphidium minutum]
MAAAMAPSAVEVEEPAPAAVAAPPPASASGQHAAPAAEAAAAAAAAAHHHAQSAVALGSSSAGGDAVEGSGASSSGGGGGSGWWGSLPANDKMVLAATFAFVLSNMGKVDMSVAMVPLTEEAGWGPSVQGLVQGIFYIGYCLACIPGGYSASRTGGRTVLPLALGVWSLATVAVPLAAVSVPSLAAARFTIGAGQGTGPSAVVDIVGRTTPPERRSNATASAFGGLHLGTVVGLLVAPPIVDALGWRALFYIYGGLGFVWYAWFEGVLMPELRRQDPSMAARLSGPLSGPAPAVHAAGAGDEAAAAAAKAPGGGAYPYRAFLDAPEVRALMATHFCNNLYYFTLLSWLPTYFVREIGMDLSQASWMSMVPAVTGFVVSNVAGRFADSLLAGGMPLPRVRKIVQTISMSGSAVSMLAALAADDPSYVVGLVILGLTLHPFTLAGLFCTPNDLSTKYAGAILGLSNTCGALGAVTGVSFCGFLLDATGSWELSMYAPLIAMLVVGNYIYVAHCGNAHIDFDARAAAAGGAGGGAAAAAASRR